MSIIGYIVVTVVAAAWAGQIWRFVSAGWSEQDERREFTWWYWPLFVLAMVGLLELIL